MLFASAIHFISLPVCAKSVGQTTYQTEEDELFSSLVDPEECYSAGKALGDVGVFPSRSYKGDGIKIGVIDRGIPADVSSYNLGGVLGTTYDNHANDVSLVLAGQYGVASDATMYFASRNSNDGYSFEDCLRWLVEDMHVDVINHSMGFGLSAFEGYYNMQNSAFLDNYIKEHNVVFVNALGNSDSAFIPTVSMAINIISPGASEKDLSYSSAVNASGYKDNLDTVIEKPTVLAPGRDLFGFNNQTMSSLDTADSYSISGTSFSAPIVTGIIALLMQEYPALKGHPETIQSIVKASTKSGVINYQLARKAAANYYNYTINNNASYGDIIFNTSVFIPQGETMYANNFVLFNGPYNHNTPSSNVDISEIVFSECKISIETYQGLVLAEATTTKSNCLLQYTNPNASNIFLVKVKLNSVKAPTGIEKACFAWRVGSNEDKFSLNYSNFNLDTCPTFQWSVNSAYIPNNISIIFYNFRGQIVLSKNNLSYTGSFVLSLSEWHDLLSLRGREFYAYVSAQFNAGKYHYSCLELLSEPKTFGQLSNINPVDFGFPEAYNNSILTSSLTIDGVGVSLERLRCGYIQEQYINLSSKKTGAGHAYLQITFDRMIKYCAFGVTLWKGYELSTINNDTAVVEYMDANGEWHELIDLLEDVIMPQYRKDILRFDVTNIKGIRFDITSVQGGDRNKGRLCIDNISFTDDSSYSDYLCSFTEPIVVRESFHTPN